MPPPSLASSEGSTRDGGRERRGEQSRIKEIVGVKPEAVIREIERYYGIKGEELRARGRRYTEPRYVASYLLRRYCLMGLRETGERMGMHYSAVGNAVRQLTDRRTGSQAKSLRRMEAKFKNP